MKSISNWFMWNDCVVVKLVRDIGKRCAWAYEECILADACEEAGALELAQYIRQGTISFEALEQITLLWNHLIYKYGLDAMDDLLEFGWLEDQKREMDNHLYPDYSGFTTVPGYYPGEDEIEF